MPRLPPPLILAYHGVADVPAHKDPEGLFISPRQLRGQINRLRRWGYEFVTFGALAAHVAPGRVALTFDDGLVDNLEQLAPLLRDEAATATTFVTTGWIGQAHPSVPYTRLMTPDEIRELRRCGVEIGAHSVTHPDMTRLDFDTACREVRDSCGRLAEIVGAPVDTFAYPYGFADAGATRAVRAAGVRAACRVRGEGSWEDPLNLPRQDNNTKSWLGFLLKRDDRYERLMRHGPARAARRLGKERRRLVSRARAR